MLVLKQSHSVDVCRDVFERLLTHLVLRETEYLGKSIMFFYITDCARDDVLETNITRDQIY